MVEAFTIRTLGSADLQAYKTLRDAMLAAHPEAFTSDAASEALKPAAAYASRVGPEPSEGSHFTLGAWRGARLVGAITCEREARAKLHHVGHVVGMMVESQAQGQGIGKALLQACIEAARAAQGLEMLTLTVTAGNDAAAALYRRAGFECFGTLRRALKHAGRYHDKDHMVLTL